MSQRTRDTGKFCWAAVQMFLLCIFLAGVYTLWCQREYCELKRAPRSFFFLRSTTGRIGELSADGHMLRSLLMKTPQATFGEARCIGRRLYWKLKQQRLLKSASGMMRQSWQLVMHGAFTAHSLQLSLQICLCLCTSKSYSVLCFLTVCLYNSLEQSNEFHDDFFFKHYYS